ncbi:MAG: organoarsenical effux MFS transporter ArsJ [Verrucomicrobiota bacterium]
MSNNVRNYVQVTGAYWAFTLTDGALRMIVLLNFHEWGYTPFQIALLFLFYEIFGVVTNFFGGWIGARLGLKSTLYAGLSIQIIALVGLSFLQADWSRTSAVAFVMAMQALSGIAKDLTKMSSKSAVKLLVPSGEQRKLFRWVAALTGSKNALKGVGFFLGAMLLQLTGFFTALMSLTGLIVVALLSCLIGVRGDFGKSSTKPKFKEVFSKSKEINWLSAARMFLFGARDVWFVVGVPVFLHETLAWSFWEVGGFLALWVIGYGFIQASAPGLIKRPGGSPPTGKSATVLALLLALTMGGLAWLLQTENIFSPDIIIMIGLTAFGIVFALNSAVHSFLIVAYSDRDKIAMNVGFYYMANAMGRLLGTVLSGFLFQHYQLQGCLLASLFFAFSAALLSFKLPRKVIEEKSDLQAPATV